MGFIFIAALCVKPRIAFTTSLCQEVRPLLTEEVFPRGRKKRELDALRRHNIQEKGFNVIEMHIREHFPYRRSLAAEQLSEEIKTGKLFRNLQCDIEVTENLRSKFDNFRPIFKKNSVCKNDIGDLMKNYAEEERILSQPRKMLRYNFILQSGTLNTLLLLFYLHLDLVCTKTHCFVEYTPKKMLELLCVVRIGRKKVSSRKSKLECPRRNNDASSRQLLRLPDHGSEPTHCNEVPQRQKNTCGY